MYEFLDKPTPDLDVSSQIERLCPSMIDKDARVVLPTDLSYLQTENHTNSLFQHTISRAVHCNGTGLHSGRSVRVTLEPALADTGVVFHRTDIKSGNARIKALYSNVTDTRLCSKISNEDDVSVGTVEHLMSALRGSGVDNVVVKLDGPEVPIMDGSAEPFAFMIECAGIKLQQDSPRKFIRLLKPVTVEDDKGGFANLSPCDQLRISVSIEFESKIIGSQAMDFSMSSIKFRNDICRARTFGFLNEVEYLRDIGLAKGGSLDNAIVINGDEILNTEGLRFDDEFVRHKVLDCLGDLSLIDGHLFGAYHGHRTGHALTNRLLCAVFGDPENYENFIPDALTN